MPEEILLMDKITKVYSNGFVANKDVTFSINKGEIHALVGENGAGKTTLMKVLFGIEQPEEGRILIKGQEVKINNPLDAIAHGVGMVHQHFMLVPSLTVAENIVLGMEPKKNGLFDMEEAVKITEEACKKYNLIVNPRTAVRDLPVGQKQKVEILKALVRGAEIIILDEPTAVLTPQETAELFVELKHLRDQGHTIVFISHKLNEIKELCDRLTVLRLGKSVGKAIVADVTEQDISRMMVLASEIAKDWGINISQIPLVGCAPEWMSEKAVSIGNYVVATGIETFLGVDPYTKGSSEVTELLQGEHGVKDWVEAKYVVELDIEKLGDRMIECIEAKRAALGI